MSYTAQAGSFYPEKGLRIHCFLQYALPWAAPYHLNFPKFVADCHCHTLIIQKIVYVYNKIHIKFLQLTLAHDTIIKMPFLYPAWKSDALMLTRYFLKPASSSSSSTPLIIADLLHTHNSCPRRISGYNSQASFNTSNISPILSGALAILHLLPK